MKSMNETLDLSRSHDAMSQTDQIQQPMSANTQARIPVADVNVLKTWYVERQFLIRPSIRLY